MECEAVHFNCKTCSGSKKMTRDMSRLIFKKSFRINMHDYRREQSPFGFTDVSSLLLASMRIVCVVMWPYPGKSSVLNILASRISRVYPLFVLRCTCG